MSSEMIWFVLGVWYFFGVFVIYRLNELFNDRLFEKYRYAGNTREKQGIVEIFMTIISAPIWPLMYFFVFAMFDISFVWVFQKHNPNRWKV